MTHITNSSPDAPYWLWLLVLLVGAMMLTIGILILLWRPTYARSILLQWAFAKRYEVLHFERCFFCGPFPWWTTSQKQMVFLVTIRDDSGQERSGWLRFGSYWGGGYKDEPDIIWKETNAD